MPGDYETWEIWYPKSSSTGLHFARGKLAPSPVLLVHAVPEVISVEVRDAEGRRLAFTEDLERTAATPICRLTRDGSAIRREDIWPTDADLRLPILLPGGEVGILQQWWHADDHNEWRWSIELHNSRR